MEQIVTPLLTWYYHNRRELPWRDVHNPYYTWISEIMLQQTRVEAVKEYFTRFIQTVPTLKDLAVIDDDALMKLWEGLGYYSRARNLKRCAIQCVEKYEGKLPDDYHQLLALPGIGPYTAGAIASIAFGLPYAAVDGNVLRVVARITNDDTDITTDAFKTRVTNLIEAILPKTRPGDFNQALMDLGASVCIPNGMPRCNVCPLREHCLGYRHHRAHLLPNKPARKSRNIEQHTILILCHRENYVLSKRPKDGLLANLYEFIDLAGRIPRKDIKNSAILQDAVIRKISKLPEAKHVFTHKEWHMHGYLVELENKISLPENCVWVSREEIDTIYPIPVALKTYRDAVMKKKS